MLFIDEVHRFSRTQQDSLLGAGALATDSGAFRLKVEMKANARKRQGDIKYPITWTELDEYLGVLQAKGVSVNVASFVGATTVRAYVLGEDAAKRAATRPGAA